MLSGSEAAVESRRRTGRSESGRGRAAGSGGVACRRGGAGAVESGGGPVGDSVARRGGSRRAVSLAAVSGAACCRCRYPRRASARFATGEGAYCWARCAKRASTGEASDALPCAPEPLCRVVSVASALRGVSGRERRTVSVRADSEACGARAARALESTWATRGPGGDGTAVVSAWRRDASASGDAGSEDAESGAGRRDGGRAVVSGED
jgi:hypothetical protein